MRRAILACLGLAVAPASVATDVPPDALWLAANGKPRLRVVLAADASAAEATAAAELVRYFERASGARFRSGVERTAGARPVPAIYVGRTEAALRAGLDPHAMSAEQWRIVAGDRGLFLLGGRPRGTLYAVYVFLERWLGVRWWTPWDEHVPRHDVLAIGPADVTGAPGFAYRDIQGVHGPRAFWAHNRVNGHFSFLPAELGGREAYGPPDQVHNFFRYVPPEEYFDTNPEFYSELEGRRTADGGQLCLTNAELAALVARKMREYVERARAEASRRSEAPPRLFAFSPNDHGGACRCETCHALVEREGTDAAPLVAFVNRVADDVGRAYPDVKIDTLAYGHTFVPPAGHRFRDNVVLRVAALYGRDFASPITAPANAAYREALEGWASRVAHLRVWDYAVTYGSGAGLPLPNLRVLAHDLRFHLAAGVEGLFVQLEHPIHSDLRDLKLWVLARLLEQPDREVDALIREFISGYYGAAAIEIRRYLDTLRRSFDRRPVPIGYPVEPDDFAYLDAELLFAAHELFDRAERRVAAWPEGLERVRRARLSLDRATVLLWADRFGRVLEAERGDVRLRLREIAERCRETGLRVAAERVPEAFRDEVRERFERELWRVARRFFELEVEAAAEANRGSGG